MAFDPSIVDSKKQVKYIADAALLPGNYTDLNTRIKLGRKAGLNNYDCQVLFDSLKWTPKLLDPTIWLDADHEEAMVLTSGHAGAFARWVDKGRLGSFHVNSTAPVIHYDDDGYRFIRFDGTDDHLETYDLAYQIDLSERTIFVVFRENTEVSDASLISINGTNNDDTSTDGLAVLTGGASDEFVVKGSSSTDYTVNSSGSGATPLGIFCEKVSGTVGTLYKNGTSVSTDSSFTAFSSTSAGGIRIGGNRYGVTGGYLNGDIGEILYFEKVLTDVERQRVEGYLAHKWGLVGDLPTSHPYKVVPVGARHISFEVNDTQCSAEIVKFNFEKYKNHYPPAFSTTYVKATTVYNTLYYAHFGIDPKHHWVSGTWESLSWQSGQFSQYTNQKYNVDFGTAFILKRIRLQNLYYGSTAASGSTRGIKNFIVYGTTSSTAFNNTTYADTTDLVELGTFQAKAFDEPSEIGYQYFEFPGNNTPYQYYVLRIADCWGETTYGMGFRHIEFQSEFSPASAEYDVQVDVISSINLEIKVSADATQDENDTYIGAIGETVAQGIWDSDYVGVWHFGQDPTIGTDCILDSTSNGNDLDPQGTFDSYDLFFYFDKDSDELIYDGSSTYLQRTALSALTSVTLEAFFKVNDTASLKCIAGQYASANNSGFMLFCEATGEFTFDGRSSTTYYSASSTSSYEDGAFHYVVGTKDSGVDWGLWVDYGVDTDSVADTSTGSLSNNSYFNVGALRDGTGAFSNALDGSGNELRLSKIVRSDIYKELTALGLHDELFNIYSEKDFLIEIAQETETLSDFIVPIEIGSGKGSNTFPTNLMLQDAKNRETIFDFRSESTLMNYKERSGLWNEYYLNRQAETKVNCQRGGLYAYLRPSTSGTNSYHSGVESRFTLVGDFDVKVTMFEALGGAGRWTPGLFLTSWNIYQNYNSGYKVRTYADGGYRYSPALPNYRPIVLRLRLVGTTLTYFYSFDHGANFSTLWTSTVTPANQKVKLINNHYDDSGDSVCCFRDFEATADSIIWDVDANYEIFKARDLDGNELPVECEYLNHAAETGRIITRKTLSSTEATKIIVSSNLLNAKNAKFETIGKAGSKAAENVWGAAYNAAWLMNNDPSGTAPQIKDSLGVSNGTTQGAMTNTDLINNEAIEFDFSDDAVSLGNAATLNPTAITIESVVDHRNFSGTKAILCKDDGSTERVFQFRINADKLEFIAFTGDATYATAASSVDTPNNEKVHLAGTFDGTTVKTFINGVQDGSASLSGNLQQSQTNNAFIAFLAAGTVYGAGYHYEHRIAGEAKSTAWLLASSKAALDSLITFSAPGQIILTQHTAFFDLLYGNVPITPYWDEPYYLTLFRQQFWNEPYGMRLEATFNLLYGNCPVITKYFDERYGDNPLIIAFFNLPYGDRLALLRYWDEKYGINKGILQYFDQPYSISEKALISYFDEAYDIKNTNPLIKYFNEYYSIMADSVVDESSIIVTIDGERVYPTHINFELNDGYFKNTVECHFAEQEPYLLVKENESILRIQDDDVDLYTVVTIPTINEEVGRTTYIITGESKSKILEDAEIFTEDFGAVSIKDTVVAIAGRYGITVDWQIPQWGVPNGVLQANDETPYEFIHRIVEEAGAIMQSDLDGNLVIKKKMESDSHQWEIDSPTYFLTEQLHFFQTSENKDEREGYNSFRISDETEEDNNTRIIPEDISENKKKIKVFRVPWDGLDLEVGTSDSNASLAYKGIKTEVIKEELISIRSGEAENNTTYPVYSIDDVASYYNDTDLGEIYFLEEGVIQTEIAGNSLIYLTYTTKYYEWILSDYDDDEIQVWVKLKGN